MVLQGPITRNIIGDLLGTGVFVSDGTPSYCSGRSDLIHITILKGKCGSVLPLSSLSTKWPDLAFTDSTVE